MNMRIFALIILSFFTQCTGKKEEKKPVDTGATYFSVTQFASDQFRTYWGQPFTLEKTVIENGKTDSSLIAASKMNWAKALKPFFDSDISKPEFLGQYRFSVLDDDATVSKTYFYEAENEALFTRTLQIVTDPFTNKIKSIFIETEKNGKTQKLFYKPVSLIQIQEYDGAFLGEDNDLRIEYRFLY